MSALEAFTNGDFLKCLDLVHSQPNEPGNKRLEALSASRLGRVDDAVDLVSVFPFFRLKYCANP